MPTIHAYFKPIMMLNIDNYDNLQHITNDMNNLADGIKHFILQSSE